MSLVPCNKQRSQNKRVTLENIFQDRLPSLGIRKIFSRQDWRKTLISPYPVRCRRIEMLPHREGAMMILSPGAQEKLMTLSDPLRREIFARLIFRRTALLIFAECRTLPAFVINELRRHHLTAVTSSLHENLLESRIKAILHEKINKTVAVHGVALEFQGWGLLIRGASGIGKTTTALAAASDGYTWIADDLAVIKKSPGGKLFISGHKKIRKYFHTGETGIMAVDRILNASQIKSKAELAFVIDVMRTDVEAGCLRRGETEMMDTRLPLMQMNISPTGYFNKNLLKKAVQELNEVG